MCLICRRGLYDFEFARSYGAYTAEMAAAVILLKYHQVTPLGGWFAKRLQDVAAREAALRNVDVIVPVPQHSVRLKERGYNQAELIAQPLARHLRVPCRSYLLLRARPRPDKLRLTVRERWRTVRGAYAVHEGTRVDNLRVLLVDDVFTTGATLDACSRVLRRAGAAYVAALTVARAVPHGQLQNVEGSPKEPYK
jgi:ComF family protein